MLFTVLLTVQLLLETLDSGGESTSSFVVASKCSSCNQTLMLNLFSKKPKANAWSWRRSFLHFFLCFLVGVFLGFTPFVSVQPSTSRIRNQHLAFDQLQLYDTNMFNNVEKLLIIVTTTPTRSRGYYLNRLAHTLNLVQPPLLWLVVETTSQSGETSELLRKSGVMYRHLVCTMNTTQINDPRVHQRNAALSHIETHRLDGIVYFADDTNIYSTQLFHHMRQIRRFGTWQVAELKKTTRLVTFVGPVCNGTQVIGWHTMRRFHAHLSGFAFNSTILWDRHRATTLQPIRHLDTVKDGFQAGIGISLASSWGNRSSILTEYHYSQSPLMPQSGFFSKG
ncbi:hypothetical protein L1987_78761 [Smallanthus sonchifolius]|uniref:Uncharacterized protein n=1 Tax=Smallanthus sonchifolius TaxID=185202 RepID=A0ACB8ZE59_9ASTR|nr:hypothetical protein L1987_78761 [Smallanthus sonchifolius]